jgi:peptidoglycan-N-acetylglucosamine deacetylase
MKKPFIYLTIDDAPSPYTCEKVDFLKKHQIPALWFLRGEFIEKYPDQVDYLIKNDSLIGNHSYSHPHFSECSLEMCFEEIQKTELLIDNCYKKVGKKRHKKWFRFPFMDKGSKNKRQIQSFLQSEGFEMIPFKNLPDIPPHDSLDIDAIWTIDAKEYALFSRKYMDKYNLYHPEDFVKKIWQQLEKQTNFYDIVLLHDFKETPHLFQPIMNTLIEKKCNFLDV